MGMSIDEAIKQLDKYTIPCGRYKEAYDFAIDTMHKYQTMQKVLEKVWNVPSCMLDEAECLNEIMETYRTVR